MSRPPTPRDEFDDHLALALTLARVSADKTQEQVAAEAEIPVLIVSRIENADRPARVTELLALCRAIGVPHSVILAAASGDADAAAKITPARITPHRRLWRVRFGSDTPPPLPV